MKKRWDIFCKIVDNFGDIGVCWRLAKQLNDEHGLQIKLWVDDLQSAKKIIGNLNINLNQQVVDNINIEKWDAAADFSQAAEVVIEAFACSLPAPYLAAMASKITKWVNLEYLSAETWVDDFHGKPSPQANSLVRHFYFPGFTEATGGLIRETNIEVQPQSHINPRPLAGESARQRGRGAQCVNLNATPLSNLSDGTTKHLTGLANDTSQVNANPASGREAFAADVLYISLFCYPNAPIHDLFTALQTNKHAAFVYVPATSILSKIAEFFGKKSVQVGDKLTQNNLTVEILPFLSQADYDALLRDCDLNFVRGEDSWVRAIWARKPFIWQPYFQTENTHIKKLIAFIDLFYTNCEQKQVLWKAHECWAAGHVMGSDVKTVWQNYLNALQPIQTYTKTQSRMLAEQKDLAAKLVIFCNNL